MFVSIGGEQGMSSPPHIPQTAKVGIHTTPTALSKTSSTSEAAVPTLLDTSAITTMMTTDTPTSFSSRLEALERNLAEEDVGQIPTELLRGPQISVALTGKKKRIPPNRQFSGEEYHTQQVHQDDAASSPTTATMPLPFMTDQQGFETLFDKNIESSRMIEKPQLLDTIPSSNEILKAPSSLQQSRGQTTTTSMSFTMAVKDRALESRTPLGNVVHHDDHQLPTTATSKINTNSATIEHVNSTATTKHVSASSSGSNSVNDVRNDRSSTPANCYTGMCSPSISTQETPITKATTGTEFQNLTERHEISDTTRNDSSTAVFFHCSEAGMMDLDGPESDAGPVTSAPVVSDSPKMDTVMINPILPLSPPPAMTATAAAPTAPQKRHRHFDQGETKGLANSGGDHAADSHTARPQKRRTTSDKNLLPNRRNQSIVDGAESQSEDSVCSTTSSNGSGDGAKTMTRSASSRSKSKKEKESVPTLVNTLRSRKKPLAAAAANIHKQGSTFIQQQAGMPVVVLDSSEEDDQVVEQAADQGPGLGIDITRGGMSETASAPLAKVTTGHGLLADLRIYAIPIQMDKGVYDRSCVMIRQFQGQWLGPPTKVVSMHYDVKKHLPALNSMEEPPTHIVTALTSMDALQKLLKADSIEPSIAIVNASWLQDTIMYKKPMDPSKYPIIKTEGRLRPQPPPPTTIKDFADSLTPPKEPPYSTALQWKNATSDLVADSNNKNDDKDSKSSSQTEFDKLVRAVKEGSLEVPEQLLEEDGDDTAPATKQQTRQEESVGQSESTGASSTGKKNFNTRFKKIWRTFGKRKEPKYNKVIVEKLQELMNYYEQNKHRGSKQDQFKVINYRKAIRAISALNREIETEEDALKVDHVGKSLAKKIGEVIAFGRILKMDHLHWDRERTSVESLFKGIYGVGLEKTAEWYEKGLRTLDDVRQLPNLSSTQLLGLKYYDDLQLRIPRTEVEKIGEVVKAAAWRLHPDIEVQVTGSFRRGKPDCGDVDIILMRPNINNGDELWQIMKHLLEDLIQQGFLVGHFAMPSYSESTMANEPQHFKYMGICRLGPPAPAETTTVVTGQQQQKEEEETQRYRHLDLLVVPHIHHGAALLYFTGNDICNRVMRAWAGRKGMSLSDKGLFAGVVRDAHYKKIHAGTWIAGRTEREVFEALQIEYREPHEREF